MVRQASVVWNGEFKSGSGSITGESGAFVDLPYSFTSRFESAPQTNPEELIAAAHASCYSMALAAFLGAAGHTPEKIETTAKVNMENMDGAWTVNRIDLVTSGSVPGLSDEEFQAVAKDAKEKCPISRLLAGSAEITLDATLAS